MLARIAEGSADYFVSPFNSIWGIAAGDLLLRKAGGESSTMEGKKILYDLKTRYVNNIVFSNTKVHRELLERLG
jgi:fructose-1,6-bisphosphatase/inositol monophosphatase family enzyme